MDYVAIIGLARADAEWNERLALFLLMVALAKENNE
jgi:hypothetical protein